MTFHNQQILWISVKTFQTGLKLSEFKPFMYTCIECGYISLFRWICKLICCCMGSIAEAASAWIALLQFTKCTPTCSHLYLRTYTYPRIKHLEHVGRKLIYLYVYNIAMQRQSWATKFWTEKFQQLCFNIIMLYLLHPLRALMRKSTYIHS